MNVVGLRCASCGAEVPATTTHPWRCPGATGAERRHVLHRVRKMTPFRPTEDPEPFVAFDAELVWAAHADAHGMGFAERVALVHELDDSLKALGEPGFTRTPFSRSAELSDALGFAADGGVWVKDETGNVAGSHKARHLATVLLHLLACERLGLVGGERSPLAIASCGNAALAAATLAAAIDWPITVFVPPAADPNVLDAIARFGATVVPCPRRGDDPPGDPCIHRFREAVALGAVPFGVQGPENALCLDGGRTIGWEIIEDLGHALDRVFVQVGGGALATCIGLAAGDEGIHARLHAVQTEGCAPLERAWRMASAMGVGVAARRWDECMWPWEAEPRSAATGILDDETYDWLGIVQAMAGSGGAPVVARESLVVEALDLGRSLTGIDVDATGTAGLAGLLALRPQIADSERVAVLFTGRRR